VQKTKVCPTGSATSVWLPHLLTPRCFAFPILQVDVDFALQGIDKLLRSQELTFAFVGVAPSFLIVYLLGGWFRSFVTQAGGGLSFTTGKGTKKQRKRKSWDSIRSVQPPSPGQRCRRQADPLESAHLAVAGSSDFLPFRLRPLRRTTQRTSRRRTCRTRSRGCCLSRSRDFAPSDKTSSSVPRERERRLVTVDQNHSKKTFADSTSLKSQEFMLDLLDLENPEVNREAKLRVVERMWRCWGVRLGWIGTSV
jgi:nuclear-control-of-ATPase protein 2